MNIKIIVSFLAGFLMIHISQAQVLKIKPDDVGQHVQTHAGTKSSAITSDLFKELNHTTPGSKWATSVRPTFSREHGNELVRQIKKSKLQAKLDSYQPTEEPPNTERAVHPAIGTNFEANWSLEGTPPDNTLAISNGGYIVTANNDGIEYYTSSGSFLYFDYWPDFFNDNSLTASIFDPKVIYDSGSDRFVLVTLHGSNANTSKVLVCFSKTNNPQDGWWVYALTGNPLNNNCWFDYPGLGVSNNEIYITGNLFQGNSFNQAVLYQIPKAPGYAGNSLDWQYWSDLINDPYDAFALVPASYGYEGNYGPGIYLVSNESSGSNAIRFWDLTDDMSGVPELNTYLISTTVYSPAADALQSGSNDQLDNGDCRIQSAFYLNGIVHFVFHSDIGEGWNGINYNRLNTGSFTNQSAILGLQGSFDYAYPAVVPFSTSQNDKSVMIAFLRSSEDIFPQIRVVNCDNNMQWSPSTLVKEGETFVDFLNDDERWGDYTGIARRHNSSGGRIWLAGCYGADIPSQSMNNTWKTWVSEVYAGATVGLAEQTAIRNFSVFPNPAYDMVNILFTTDLVELTTISLYDVEGRMIKVLYKDTPRVGENRLTFNKGALPAGAYLVSIFTSTKLLKNETIVILD
jgi:hypothetical protein